MKLLKLNRFNYIKTTSSTLLNHKEKPLFQYSPNTNRKTLPIFTNFQSHFKTTIITTMKIKTMTNQVKRLQIYLKLTIVKIRDTIILLLIKIK